MQSSLYDTLKNYSKSNAIRFHMPAHNGENIGITTDMDITELSFSDNLISADGVIANTEQNIAQAYNSNYALMLTCGATSGVAIALHTALQFGNNLLIVGECHKSVHNYANVFRFNLAFVEKVDKSINFDNFSAVVITTPDYFGNTTNIDLLKGINPLVIVDASHGSHFAFCDKLPNLQTNIADITILSFHKTLPVLTGGAGIVCNDMSIYEHLCYSRSILHSTSPNYLIMASIDKSISNLTQNGQILYKKVIEEIDNFSKKLCDKYTIVTTDDKTRLNINLNGYSADYVKNLLEENNIYIEMAYSDTLVLIVTPYNYKHLDTLANVLNSINFDKKNQAFCKPNTTKITTNSKKIQFVAINDALGYISAGNIGVYPPGTPIINIGDFINNDVIDFLTNYQGEIFGLINNKIPVYYKEKL